MKRSLLIISRPIGILTGLYAFSNIHVAQEFRHLFTETAFERLKVSISNQYLTNIASFLTIFALALLIVNEYKKLQILGGLVPAVCSLNFLVTAMYWILYAIDPALVWNPEIIKQGFRPFLFADICAHGLPYAILMANSCPYIQKEQMRPRLWISGMVMGYIFFLQWHAISGRGWVYPILDKFSDFLRYFFLLLMGFVLHVHYTVVCKLHLSIRKKLEKNKNEKNKNEKIK